MSLRRFALALIVALAVGSAFMRAQIPGQNINMVTGTKFPGGDPFLQKQNEPSLAVSTRNPCHLLAGANDYRAVNLQFPQGSPADKENGDAWVGWYTSIDCGQTWYSTLVPGYQQDASAEGKASPVFGLTAGADPTVRAGAGGFFAYSFIAFNRGSNVGKVAVARFIDKNTKEAVTKAENAITYVDTKAWDTGSAGQFIDKPTIVVTPGTGTCSVGGISIPASVVHMAWTVFVGNDVTIRTKVYYARSSNCGATLDYPPTKLSEGYAVNQSASIGVGPNGSVHVVWRQFATDKGDTNQILFAKSVDGGKSFTKAVPVPVSTVFTPFDQGTTSKSFRTNGFATVAVDQYNRLYLAVAVRGFAGNQSRIVVTSLDPVSGAWTMPQAVPVEDVSAAGHQIMPAMTAVGGKLNLVWLDFRDDVSGHFDQFIQEIYPVRHTVDVRGAQATLNQNGTLSWTTYGILDSETAPVATAPRISRYLTGNYTNPAFNTVGRKQLQFNRVNLKLYAGGTRPFIGDYIDVAGLAFLLQQTAQGLAWVPNDGTLPSDGSSPLTAAQTFYAAWTDNRDANVGFANPEPPADTGEGASVAYNPPNSPLAPNACSSPALTKTRNANVYMARITPGLFVAAPANTKPSVVLINGASVPIQRAFPVLVQNRTAQTRTFRITIMNQPPAGTGVASFVQIAYPFPSPLPAPVLTADVIVPSNSSVARAVYIVSSTRYPRIKIDVVEMNNQVPVPGGLTGSTILNPDIDNPDIDNPDIDNTGIQNPDIDNAEVHNPDIDNPDIDNPDIDNPDIDNPDIDNPDIDNPDIDNPDIDNPDIDNPDIDNPDIDNPDIDNPDIDNGSVTDFSTDLVNHGNTTTAYQVKASVFGQTSPYLFQLIGRRVYKTPTSSNCNLTQTAQNQVLFNISNPNITPGGLPNPLDPSATNATVLVQPGERIRITLRAWDKDVLTGAGAPQNDGIQPFCPMLSPLCTTVTSTVTITATSLSSNTGDNTPPSDTTSSTATVPGTATVINTNDSGPGSLRQAIIDANNQPAGGFISFAIPGAGVHTISPASALPQLTKPIVIDARTQPGYAGAPLIELNGTNAGATAGLVLAANDSAVRGLAINRFNGNGLTVLSSNNEIIANYIGTSVTGTQAQGNAGSGIQIIDRGNNFIGGTTAAARNVISGNNGEGIRIDGAPATGNVVRGNYIGTNAAGNAALGNTNSGLYVRRAPANFVIGNVISGNTGFAGVAICGNQSFCGGGDIGTPGSDAAGNIVRANLIGTDASGSAAIGNVGSGVSLDTTSNTVVGGPDAVDANTIAFNGQVIGNPGVNVFGLPGSGNQFRRNSIHSNGGLGIDLGANQVSPNDYANFDNILVNDQDTGPNGFQNFPDLTSATLTAGTTLIQGTLRSAPNTLFTIDLFNGAFCDASGNGEGQTLIQSFTVTTDGTGVAPISASVTGLPSGSLVTATATSPVDGTSEFSNCQMVLPTGFAFSAPSAGGNGHVYEYVQTPGTWTNAKAAAAGRTFRGVNGHLVTITNAFENSLVGAFRGANNDLRGWIGLTDEATEGSFQWITGEPVTYNAWNTGEPNAQSAGEDYVEIFAAAVWNDNTDSNGLNQGYVVEYDVNPFEIGVLTDEAGDSGTGPDLVFARLVNTGTNLFVKVEFQPGTFNKATTLAQLLLDLDRNPATGHPGVNSGCVTDAGIIGSEYIVDILDRTDDAVDNPTAQIRQYAGACNQFTVTATIPVNLTTNGYVLQIPLTLLGGDDGAVNFKFTSATELGPNSYTGVQDTMSNPGVLPGTTAGGGS